MGPITKRPSGPRQMGSSGRGPQPIGESGWGLGGRAGSPQSRLWRRLGTGEPWSFNLVTLSGLPEPGAELGKDRRSGSDLTRFVAQQRKATASKQGQRQVVRVEGR